VKREWNLTKNKQPETEGFYLTSMDKGTTDSDIYFTSMGEFQNSVWSDGNINTLGWLEFPDAFDPKNSCNDPDWKLSSIKPDYNGWFIVTIKCTSPLGLVEYDVCIWEFINGEWDVTDLGDGEEIVAWMVLPDPFIPEEETHNQEYPLVETVEDSLKSSHDNMVIGISTFVSRFIMENFGVNEDDVKHKWEDITTMVHTWLNTPMD